MMKSVTPVTISADEITNDGMSVGYNRPRKMKVQPKAVKYIDQIANFRTSRTRYNQAGIAITNPIASTKRIACCSLM